MEICTCWYQLDKFGSNTPLRGVTPPELVLLVHMRKDLIGKHPVSDLEIKGTIRRSFDLERERLRQKYGRNAKTKTWKIDEMYPGAAANFPDTFEKTGLLEASKTLRVTNEPVTPMPDDSKLPPVVTDESELDNFQAVEPVEAVETKTA